MELTIGFLLLILIAAVITFLLKLKDKVEDYTPESIDTNQLGLREVADLQVRFKEASNDYYKSLSELKTQPNNADLKSETLQLGREYSIISRQFYGMNPEMVYDEVALMNDIDAACAGANYAVNTNNYDSSSIEERLSKLTDLRDRNLISEEEYNSKRKQILDTI